MPKAPLSGQDLVEDFRTVLTSSAANHAAKHEATSSENALLDHLRDLSGGFLQPSSLTADDPDMLSRASLDAHVKKIQAQQFEQLTTAQQASLQQAATERYVGRRVRVTVSLPDLQPIDSVWFDPRKGYRTVVNRRRKLIGTVREVRLDQNALLIRPNGLTRLFNSRLQGFVAYIIDPQTMMAMVHLQF